MEIFLTYTRAPKTLKDKIMFIKNIKELLGLGLKEAKDFTDNLEASGKGQFTLPADELPHHFRIALAKEDITWENADAKPSAPQNDNTICLLKFSGDILQEMDLKSYLYKQFRFNYLDAAELIEQLKKGESINIDINPAEKDFISGVLERYGVAHHFGAPPAKTHAIAQGQVNLNELAQKFKNIDADISLCLSNNPDITVSKLHLVKILRQYSAENWDLLASKIKAEEMLDKGKIIVKVHSSNFVAFAAEIKELKLHLETYSL
jgi:hypothetical protein